MFDANMRFITVGTKFFAKVMYIDKAVELKKFYDIFLKNSLRH